jgi:hypothetical protein
VFYQQAGSKTLCILGDKRRKEILRERNVVGERENECKKGYKDERNEAFLNPVQFLQGMDKIMETLRNCGIEFCVGFIKRTSVGNTK